jgi:hypothetical protein
MVDFSGKWRVNLAKSKFIGQPPDDILVEIKHVEPRLEQSMVMTSKAGKEHLECVFTTGGEEWVNVIRGVDWRMHAHWDGAELIIESVVKTPARVLRLRDYWSLSGDGRTLVMEHRGDDLDGQRAVLDRV